MNPCYTRGSNIIGLAILAMSCSIGYAVQEGVVFEPYNHNRGYSELMILRTLETYAEIANKTTFSLSSSACWVDTMKG
jgi:hypothetical protein